jgi:hypothetical protein
VRRNATMGWAGAVELCISADWDIEMGVDYVADFGREALE